MWWYKLFRPPIHHTQFCTQTYTIDRYTLDSGWNCIDFRLASFSRRPIRSSQNLRNRNISRFSWSCCLSNSSFCSVWARCERRRMGQTPRVFWFAFDCSEIYLICHLLLLISFSLSDVPGGLSIAFIIDPKRSILIRLIWWKIETVKTKRCWQSDFNNWDCSTVKVKWNFGFDLTRETSGGCAG